MTRKLNTTLIALLACAACLAAAVLAGAPADDALTAATDVEAGAGDAADHPIDRAGAAFRGGLALPYFSFARGVRRIGG